MHVQVTFIIYFWKELLIKKICSHVLPTLAKPCLFSFPTLPAMFSLCLCCLAFVPAGFAMTMSQRHCNGPQSHSDCHCAHQTHFSWDTELPEFPRFPHGAEQTCHGHQLRGAWTVVSWSTSKLGPYKPPFCLVLHVLPHLKARYKIPEGAKHTQDNTEGHPWPETPVSSFIPTTYFFPHRPVLLMVCPWWS